MVTFNHRGSFTNTENFLKRASKLKQVLKSKILDRYGMRGVEALSAATPERSGKTASSWSYEVYVDDSHASITWSNSNVNKGVNIAMILQYGHGTRNGGYVQGIDYINPAMRPIFEKIADEAWEEVTGK